MSSSELVSSDLPSGTKAGWSYTQPVNIFKAVLALFSQLVTGE